MKTFLTLIVCSFASAVSVAQDMVVFQSDMRSRATTGYDPTVRRNIGAYIVEGNSHLMKGNNVTDLFTSAGVGLNQPVVFDTYTQQLSILQEDKKSVIELEMKEVDSFYLKVDNDKKLQGPVMFRNMSKVDPSLKLYMQELVGGKRYKLYKSYFADMVGSSTNLSQSNLKKFEIRSDYYFLDTQSANKKPVKIKSNLKSLNPYFENNTSVLKLIADYPKKNVEEKLVVIFETADAS